MVYSAIETTCFDLYWPSSGFYNIEEESINAVKTVRGFLTRYLQRINQRHIFFILCRTIHIWNKNAEEQILTLKNN